MGFVKASEMPIEHTDVTMSMINDLMRRIDTLEAEIRKLKSFKAVPVDKSKGFVLTCRKCMGKHTVFYLNDKKQLPEGWTRCPHCGEVN
jgi:hypothetical protein